MGVYESSYNPYDTHSEYMNIYIPVAYRHILKNQYLRYIVLGTWYRFQHIFTINLPPRDVEGWDHNKTNLTLFY